MSEAGQSTSMHTIELHVQNALDWNDVEQKAADTIARYYALPRRGRYSESRHALLAGATVRARLNAEGLFDATVEVVRT
jgi:hypothetical protein